MILEPRDALSKTIRQPAIAQLSREAIRHAARFRGTGYGRLQSRLYFYNRVPFSEAWRAQFGGAVPDWTRFGLTLDAQAWPGWRPVSSTLASGWVSFARGRRKPVVGAKLYISPTTDRMPDLLRILANRLADTECISFKFGSDVPSLLRPDKCVAYFTHTRAMFDAASMLADELADFPAHGAPFTAQFGATPLLSWGIDPPVSRDAGTTSTSWRLWVCSQIAQILADAPPDRYSEDEAEQIVCRTLMQAGVDTDRWHPTAITSEVGTVSGIES